MKDTRSASATWSVGTSSRATGDGSPRGILLDMKNAWLGSGLMLAGLVSMLYFAAAVLDLLPEAGSAWPIPDRLQVGLGSALFGIVATALGALLAIRQAALPRVRNTRSEDAGRREPFIGPAIDTGEAASSVRRRGVRTAGA